MYWNVQGLYSKFNEIGSYLNEFELIILSETWIEKNNTQNLEQYLPKTYIWKWTHAKRENVKGRAIGGNLLGIRNTIEFKNFWDCPEKCVTTVEIKIKCEWWKIIAVYNRSGLLDIRSTLLEQLENNKGQRCLLMGDLNCRIGTLGGKFENSEGELLPRNTKDKFHNKEGEIWVDLLDEYGLTILNGNINGDFEGEFTHIDYKSESVIDYGAANDIAWSEIDSFIIGNMECSDHFPLEITLKESCCEIKLETKLVQQWKDKDKSKYTEAMSKTDNRETEDWNIIKDNMWKNTPKRKIKNQNSVPKSRWFDRECYEARQKVKHMGVKAKQDQKMWIEYKREKRYYKNLIKCKKSIFNSRYKEELKNIKNINQAWSFIKKQRTKTSEYPKPADIANHFMSLLEGHEAPNLVGNIDTVNKEFVGLSWSEFNSHISKLKLNKASGDDQLKAEAIIYADKVTKGNIKAIMEKCLNGQSIPENWRDSIIWPIHKKGSKTNAENYRGIAIGNAIYKLYANIVNSRLENFIESQNILPDTQNGFRKLRSTTDNIYILNHIINSKLHNGKKIYAFFVDFKSAFDTIDRSLLFKKLEKLNVPEYIIGAIKDLYRRTPFKVQDRRFYTERGLKQGCPLSPLLFAIYISDLEKTLRNYQSGGIVIGKQKVFSLAYADDLVILSERKEDMREMMELLSRYTKRKALTINKAKSQIVVFSRGGRKTKEAWGLDGSRITEVSSFKYLGFTFQANGKYTKHIEDMAANGKRRVAEVWGIGHRKFEDNFSIRMEMFKSLILPAITYGAEITGWSEWESIELTQRRYLRWILGLDRGTRKAVLMEETKTSPMYIETGVKAMKYEERIRNSPCLILRECLIEVHKGLKNNWTDMRSKYCNRNGWAVEEVNAALSRGESVWHPLMMRDMECWQQLQFNRLQSSHYRFLQTSRVPWYLQRGRNVRLIARFRCGNEERGRDKWGTDHRCRICGEAIETVDHLRESCCPDQRNYTSLLNERGNGEGWMRRVLNARKAKQMSNEVQIIVN